MPARITFASRTAFSDELRRRVKAYFEATGRSEQGDWRLWTKALVGFGLLVLGYVYLVFYASSLLGAALSAFAVVQGFILIAFNVMHDGGHGSFSRRRWVNRLMGATMDLMGSSSMLWRQKHNQLHHTYTNIDGKDDDIALGVLMRLSPHQPWKPWHRFQTLYAPVFYALLTLFLFLFSDWQRFLSGRIGETPLHKMAWWERPYFVLTKVAYVGYALVLPSFFHPVWQVLLMFLAIHLIFGLTLSVVFQLAHTVEGAGFIQPDPSSHRMPDDWTTHQLKTTANFAPGNRLATFYMGGLNYQVEHHLFHHVSHVHYPALSRIVRETCTEYGEPYQSFPSVGAALVAHFKFLHRMGQRPSSTPAAAAA